MTTSGTIVFSETRDQFIRDALGVCGILAEGETATGQQITDGARALNNMVKAWKAMGINLWCYQEVAIFPVIGQTSYNLSATGDRASANYAVTTLSVSAAAAASTITLTSITGVATTYNIGIVLDAGTIQWTTINGAPTGYVVTLTATLTGAASSGNLVYVYQTIANRPLRVSAGRVKINNGSEIPMKIISREEYFRIPLKTTQGKPTQLYYDPQLTHGQLYIWSTIQYVNDLIIVTAQREIEDFNTLADTADFPSEWNEAIIYNLAARMMLPYGIDKVTRDDISVMAQGFLESARDFDQEATSIFFAPMSEE